MASPATAANSLLVTLRHRWWALSLIAAGHPRRQWPTGSQRIRNRCDGDRWPGSVLVCGPIQSIG
jgi:hypothetical protein